jgi:hypothetical protein
MFRDEVEIAAREEALQILDGFRPLTINSSITFAFVYAAPSSSRISSVGFAARGSRSISLQRAVVIEEQRDRGRRLRPSRGNCSAAVSDVLVRDGCAPSVVRSCSMNVRAQCWRVELHHALTHWFVARALLFLG